MGESTIWTLKRRLEMATRFGSRASERKLGSVEFPVARDRGRKSALSYAFQRMSQLERMGFLIRFRLLWQQRTVADRQEITDCFGPLIAQHLADGLEVKVTDDGRHLHCWLTKFKLADFPDAGGARRDLFCAISAADPELIDELYEAASVTP